jgi:hypothetical protein
LLCEDAGDGPAEPGGGLGVEWSTRDIKLWLRRRGRYQLCEDAGVDVPAELEEADLLISYVVAARYGSKSPTPVVRATALHFAVRWAIGVEP